jgi:hypothetical protein
LRLLPTIAFLKEVRLQSAESLLDHFYLFFLFGNYFLYYFFVILGTRVIALAGHRYHNWIYIDPSALGEASELSGVSAILLRGVTPQIHELLILLTLLGWLRRHRSLPLAFLNQLLHHHFFVERLACLLLPLEPVLLKLLSFSLQATARLLRDLEEGAVGDGRLLCLDFLGSVRVLECVLEVTLIDVLAPGLFSSHI